MSDRGFFARDGREVAPELLGAVLEHQGRTGRIVEVEAYAGVEDPGSHGYRGPTPRTATMFGPPGHLYVYFTYGMHWCANVVCGPEGTCSAVLLRALAPLEGLEDMYAARGPAARRDRDLCSGPAKLCQALGLDGDNDGDDLCGADGPRVRELGARPDAEIVNTTRIGLTKGTDLPWRWFLAGDPNVSR
ncbi:MAG: DNA-3-methyladenine glycosylase [Actinomycetota bacterium]